MLNIKVDNKADYTLRMEDGRMIINSDAVHADLIKIGENRYHALLNNQSVTIELLRKDETGKKLEVIINGKKQNIAIEDEYDKLLKQLGMDKLMTNKVNDIKAPMPGMVLSIKVKEGDAVVKGDTLLVLEAMKMENVIKAPADAVVKKIMISEKTAVEKNQMMMVFEG